MTVCRRAALWVSSHRSRLAGRKLGSAPGSPHSPARKGQRGPQASITCAQALSVVLERDDPEKASYWTRLDSQGPQKGNPSGSPTACCSMV